MLEFLTLNCLHAKKEGKEHFTSSENVTLSAFVMVLVALAAAYFAYECNRKDPNRMFITFLAFLFSNFYLLYYFIYYVLMGNKCRK